MTQTMLAEAAPSVPIDTTTLDVSIMGMSCAACVRRVERALTRVPGVVGASVNLATEHATVQIDPLATPDDEVLVASVTKAGYQAVVNYPDIATHEDLVAADVARRQHLADVRQRRLIVGVVLTIPILILHMVFMGFLPGVHWVLLALTIPVWLYTGWEFHRGALQAVRHGNATMDLLVSLGSTAALGLSIVATIAPRLTGGAMYFDTTALIITLISLGKYLEARARAQASQAITQLMQLQPETATVLRQGQEREVPLGQVRVGDVVLVRPGQRIPVDGTILQGTTTIDASLLTGESVPVDKGVGDAVVGGTINLTGVIHLRATQVGVATVLAGIIRAVDRAQASKAPVQRLADQVASIFVPVVIGLALLTFVGWWLAIDAGHLAMHGAWSAPGTGGNVLAPTWVRALAAGIAVLVVACPCALGLATPIAIIVGTGRGAEQGILIKDGASLERAHAVTAVLFDKTGTLTTGQPMVTHIVPVHQEKQRRGVQTRTRHVQQTTWNTNDLLRFVVAAEQGSTHPLAQAIVRERERQGLAPLTATAIQEIAGQGITAQVAGRVVLVGRRAFLAANHIALPSLDRVSAPIERSGQTTVLVAIDGQPAGVIGLADTLRPDAATAIAALQARGIATWMVTGDNPTVAAAIATHAGIDPEHVIAGVLPTQKMAHLRQLREAGAVVAFVGDGINDAPALVSADIGIALGTGTEIALETADITLVDGSLGGVARALALSRRTLRIIRQNLAWAFGYNAVLIPLAIASPAIPFLQAQAPILAAGAMTLSSVTVVTNALRLRGRSLLHGFPQSVHLPRRWSARQRALVMVVALTLALGLPWLTDTLSAIAPTQPYHPITQTAGPYRITLTFPKGTPHAGVDDAAQLQVLTSAGQPATGATITWRWEMVTMDMGVEAGHATPNAVAGMYDAQLIPLMDGEWHLTATIHRAGEPAARVGFDVPVHG